MDKLPTIPKNPRTVLLVENEPELAVFLQRLLEENGFQTQWADDASQARQVLQGLTPDLIVLELIMPEESGFHLYCELRLNEDWGAIPIMVVADVDGARDQLLSYCKFLRGKNVPEPEAFLGKPVEGEEFLQMVECLLVPGNGSKRTAKPWDEGLPGQEILDRAGDKTLDPLPVFEALGNSTRMQMLELMASHKEICVCELVQILGLSQSGVSSHLTVLRHAGIVKSRKEGLWVFYAVDLDALHQAFAAIDTGLTRLLTLSSEEDPDARLREKVESGACCPSSAGKLTATA